ATRIAAAMVIWEIVPGQSRLYASRFGRSASIAGFQKAVRGPASTRPGSSEPRRRLTLVAAAFAAAAGHDDNEKEEHEQHRHQLVGPHAARLEASFVPETEHGVGAHRRGLVDVEVDAEQQQRPEQDCKRRGAVL